MVKTEKKFGERGAEVMRNVNILATGATGLAGVILPGEALWFTLTAVNAVQVGFWEWVRRQAAGKAGRNIGRLATGASASRPTAAAPG